MEEEKKKKDEYEEYRKLQMGKMSKNSFKILSVERGCHYLFNNIFVSYDKGIETQYELENLKDELNRMRKRKEQTDAEKNLEKILGPSKNEHETLDIKKSIKRKLIGNVEY